MILITLSLASFTTIVPVFSIIALLLAAIIVIKAFRGYRQNNDTAMLLLAGGLFLLVLAPVTVELMAAIVLDETIELQIVVEILRHVFRIAGLGAILASMYISG